MKDKLLKATPFFLYLILVVSVFVVYKEQVNYQFILSSFLLIVASFYIIYDIFFKVKNKIVKIIFNVFMIITIILMVIFISYKFALFVILIPLFLYNIFKVSKE